MDILNEYLKQLVSTSGYELHLEPNTNPYVVSANGSTDVGKSPLLGSQISMMVFPLIPADIKQDLPNMPAIQFVHPSNIGDFSFTVHKSPAGFSVTIKPLLGNAAAVENASFPAVETPASGMPAIDLQPLGDAVLERFDSTVESSSGLPEVGGGDWQEQVAAAEVYEPISFEQEAEPPHLNIADVAETMVEDRRSVDRSLSGDPVKDRMESLFYRMYEAGAPDLHLSVGMPPIARKDGRMHKLEWAEPVVTSETIRELLLTIMPARNQDEFALRRDTDFTYSVAAIGRFRCNVFMDRKGLGAVFRMISAELPTAASLHLPGPLMDLCRLEKGLVIVTGPAGSGRSTTLCAMIDHINTQREGHIITIEDPIEFVHENRNCLVNQREVHNHTSSFQEALRAALREDPDVIMLSEMRDMETISMALEAAEAGILVLAAFHTPTAQSIVDRIVDQFPTDRQQQIRVMLSQSLKGILAQSLQPKAVGGRAAVFDVLAISPSISSLIREGEEFQRSPSM